MTPAGVVSGGAYSYGFQQGTSSVTAGAGFTYGANANTWDDASNNYDTGARDYGSSSAPSRSVMTTNRKMQRVTEIWSNEPFGTYLSGILCDEQDWKFYRYSTDNVPAFWHMKNSLIFNTPRRGSVLIKQETGGTSRQTFNGAA